MAKCIRCDAPALPGEDYCKKCKMLISRANTDESYLDSLLNSVVSNAGKNSPDRRRTTRNTKPQSSGDKTASGKTVSSRSDVFSAFDDDEFNILSESDLNFGTDSVSDDSYSIFDDRSDEEYLDSLFEMSTSKGSDRDFDFEDRHVSNSKFKKPDFIEKVISVPASTTDDISDLVEIEPEALNSDIPQDLTETDETDIAQVLTEEDGTDISQVLTEGDETDIAQMLAEGDGTDIAQGLTDDLLAEIGPMLDDAPPSAIDAAPEEAEALIGEIDSILGSGSSLSEEDSLSVDIDSLIDFEAPSGNSGDPGDIPDLELMPDISDLADVGDIASVPAPEVEDTSDSFNSIDISGTEDLLAELEALSDASPFRDNDIPDVPTAMDEPPAPEPVVPEPAAPELSSDISILEDLAVPGIDSDILSALGINENEIGQPEAAPFQNEEDKLKNEDDLALAGMLSDFSTDSAFSSDSQLDLEQVMSSIESGEFEKELSELVPEEEKAKTGKKKKKKKKGFFARIFGNVKEDYTPEQLKEMYEKEQKAEQDKLEAKKQAEEAAKLSKEEQKKLKAEQAAEAKQKAAADKAEAAARKKEAKEAAAEEKKRKKEEKLALEAAQIPEYEGRINRVGATVLLVLFTLFTLVIIIGTQKYTYDVSIKNAETDFGRQRYNEAYKDVYGLEIQDEDIELYDKILTVMYVNKQLNSYHNFMKNGMEAEALDSLVKGLGKYEKYKKLAAELGISRDLDYVKEEIVDELENTFHISEADAIALANIKSQPDYSTEIYEFFK